MKQHLTKSDYTRWQFCPTSAFYGWERLPSNQDANSFLQYLAEEGKTIGMLARRLFARGRLICEKDSARAEQLTRAALEAEQVTLYEACVTQGDFVVRPDIMIRKGDKLFVIEVKSKLGRLCWHQEGKMLITMYGGVRAAYRDIVYDLAFQSEVLERAFPDLEILPYFLLPEEASEARGDEVELLREGFFPDDECITDEVIQQRRNDSILKFFKASEAIRMIREQTAQEMDAMAEAWRLGDRPEPKLRYGCRNCVFRLQNGRDKGDGFHQCWKALAEPDPHIYSLYQLYSLKNVCDKNSLLADAKIAQGKTSLFDISESELHGEHQHRQRLQLRSKKSGEEWIDPKLGEAIESLSWPVAFVDFETSLQTMPWYAGVKPGQVLPFQFSVHVLSKDGQLTQLEWLNTRDEIPTFEFIKQLKAALDEIPSILVYTNYENQILEQSLHFLKRYGDESREERAWIFDLLHSGRIVDQHQWVYDWYQHPEMDRISIKVVLPAIWRGNSSLHHHPHFEKFYQVEQGEILDPYKTLPDTIINGEPYCVREGTGAMIAYREMMLGVGSRDPAAKAALAAMLRNYVTLDTLSQLMIFEHWRQRLEAMKV